MALGDGAPGALGPRCWTVGDDSRGAAGAARAARGPLRRRGPPPAALPRGRDRRPRPPAPQSPKSSRSTVVPRVEEEQEVAQRILQRGECLEAITELVNAVKQMSITTIHTSQARLVVFRGAAGLGKSLLLERCAGALWEDGCGGTSAGGGQGSLFTTRHHRRGGGLPHPRPHPFSKWDRIFFRAFGQSKISLAPSAPSRLDHEFSSVPLAPQHHPGGGGGLDTPPPSPAPPPPS